MRVSLTIAWLTVALLILPAHAAVTLTRTQHDAQICYRMSNGRISLLIDPQRGGAVVAYRDKLGGNVNLIPNKPRRGLCMDHFQKEVWPGEMLDASYKIVGHKQSSNACQISLQYHVTGQWKNNDYQKLANLTLEKTYILRANSPALECDIKITAPKKHAKLFAYWQQHVFFAGGTYNRDTDKTFRPSTRGVRVKAGENFGYTGPEHFIRDPVAGWMALLDTKQKTGLVCLSNYNQINALYASGGNHTIEPMYRITYLPAGQSLTYHTYIVPVVGMDNVVSATKNYIAGYHMKTNGKGTGRIAISVIRSVQQPESVTMNVSLLNVENRKNTTDVGSITFNHPAAKPTTHQLTFHGAGDDPLVMRVKTNTKNSAGHNATGGFFDYYNGTYKWGENIKTDMVTPVYRANRPPRKLHLRKPSPLRLVKKPGVQMWYAHGLLDGNYRIADAAHITSLYRDGRNHTVRNVAFTRYSANWQTRLSSFPYDYHKLLSYDMLILGGVTQRALGAVGQQMICDYIHAGGGIVMLGGPFAYGGSHLHGTPLAKLMPVKMADTPFDLADLHGAPIKRANDADAPFLNDLNFALPPRVRYLHKVKVKSWGHVVLTADGRPFLVVGTLGPHKARIACILGAAMGSLGNNQTPFWKWKDWPYLMRQLNWWVLKQDGRFTVE